ncbi:hypothetical protein C8F04DRAFT_1274534 [Mycena alexandri]|uniref:Uncharacterized protein n=1 Tax=Mycena alexandri TaxID=1745969 RepID=A0AAD6WRB2_9AGAR|nr:hypothetical protein C8F04DRAFT_1274534 [Mycena alexandri]
MSSNAGPSSSRQTPLCTTRGLPKKSPAAVSATLPATGDFASPRRPSISRRGRTRERQHRVLARETLRARNPGALPTFSPTRLTLTPSTFSKFTTPWSIHAWWVKLWRTSWPTWTKPSPFSPTFAPALSVPPWLLPLPFLPPLIPDSDVPYNPTDELDEAAEEELTEFSRRRQARFDERKALRENYRATCERVQREHEAAFWAEQDHLPVMVVSVMHYRTN